MNEQKLTLIKYNTGDQILIDNGKVIMVCTHDHIFWNKDMPSLMRLYPLFVSASSLPSQWRSIWNWIKKDIFPLFMVTFVVSAFIAIITLLLHSL